MPTYYKEKLIHGIYLYNKYVKKCDNFNEWDKLYNCLEAMKLGKKAYREMIKEKDYSKTYHEILYLIKKTENDIKIIENVQVQITNGDNLNNKYNKMLQNLNAYVQGLRIGKKACDEYYIFNCCK